MHLSFSLISANSTQFISILENERNVNVISQSTARIRSVYFREFSCSVFCHLRQFAAYCDIRMFQPTLQGRRRRRSIIKCLCVNTLSPCTYWHRFLMSINSHVGIAGRTSEIMLDLQHLKESVLSLPRK